MFFHDLNPKIRHSLSTEKWIKHSSCVYLQRLHSVNQLEYLENTSNQNHFLSDLTASFPRKKNCIPPGQDCKWPEEPTNYSIPCFNPLCTTYQLPDNNKCPDIRLVFYAPLPGCKCVDGWAQISPGECAEVGTCECPEVSDILNPDLYSVAPSSIEEIRLIG